MFRKNTLFAVHISSLFLQVINSFLISCKKERAIPSVIIKRNMRAKVRSGFSWTTLLTCCTVTLPVSMKKDKGAFNRRVSL